jgi:hypothetical protein
MIINAKSDKARDFFDDCVSKGLKDGMITKDSNGLYHIIFKGKQGQWLRAQGLILQKSALSVILEREDIFDGTDYVVVE